MSKTARYWQLYWNCNGFRDKFDNIGWQQYHSDYRKIVVEARLWCDNNCQCVDYSDAWPFVLTFYDKNDLLKFKIVWGSGKVLESYNDRDYIWIGDEDV